jgi:hypothetical protein
MAHGRTQAVYPKGHLPQRHVATKESGVGRFVPARKFDRIQMPIWKDLAPRFGVVYDLFGNAKTAIKAGINKYEQAQTVALAESFNPLILTSAIVNWTDLKARSGWSAGRRGTRPIARVPARRAPW